METTLLTGWYMCTENSEGFTKDRIYRFKNGQCLDDDGHWRPCMMPLTEKDKRTSAMLRALCLVPFCGVPNGWYRAKSNCGTGFHPDGRYFFEDGFCKDDDGETRPLVVRGGYTPCTKDYFKNWLRTYGLVPEVNDLVNGWYMCTRDFSWNSGFTSGRIYHFIGGFCTDDNGKKRPGNSSSPQKYDDLGSGWWFARFSLVPATQRDIDEAQKKMTYSEIGKKMGTVWGRRYLCKPCFPFVWATSDGRQVNPGDFYRERGTFEVWQVMSIEHRCCCDQLPDIKIGMHGISTGAEYEVTVNSFEEFLVDFREYDVDEVGEDFSFAMLNEVCDSDGSVWCKGQVFHVRGGRCLKQGNVCFYNFKDVQRCLGENNVVELRDWDNDKPISEPYYGYAMLKAEIKMLDVRHGHAYFFDHGVMRNLHGALRFFSPEMFNEYFVPISDPRTSKR